MSGVVRLPEVLCVHLKRFRHELMFSAKVAARVSFPINDLNMAPYTHKGNYFIFFFSVISSNNNNYIFEIYIHYG